MSRDCILAILILFLISVPLSSSADELANDEPALGGPDATSSMLFVPKLASAWYIDGAFTGGGSLTELEPPSFGFYTGFGYKHFVADRTTAFWKFGTYGYGLSDTVLGNEQGFGLDLGLASRLMSEDWFFGGLGLNLNTGVIFREQQLENALPETGIGFQVGLGLETTFGTLFVLDPYLFAEFGTGFSVQSNWINGDADFSALARMFVRFDWAQRDSDWYREASPEPWE